jgi:FkbM family methyltransferase
MGLAKTVRRRIESLGLPRRPQIRCPLEFHGSRRCGWTVCPEDLSAGSIVYSAGLGKDISFDRSLIATFGLTVFGFDPTPPSVAWLRQEELPPGFRSLAVGLAGYEGTAWFSPSVTPREVSHTLLSRPATTTVAIELPVRRLGALMSELGHDRLDLLKLDVEGAEYAVIDEIVQLRHEVRQLLVEFHHRFPGVGRARTLAAIHGLKAMGFRIAHVSSTGREYTFVRA